VHILPYTAPAPTTSTQASAARGSTNFFPLADGVEGDQPLDVVLALNGAVAVVALHDTDSLEFYDSSTGSRLGQVSVPDGPVDLELSPDGGTVLVACRLAGRVAVVDVASRTLLRDFNVSRQPYQVSALSDGVRAVVGCDSVVGGGAFDVIDWTAGATIRSIATPAHSPPVEQVAPWAGVLRPMFGEFAVTPDDRRIVMPSNFDRRIRIFDIVSGVQVFASPRLSRNPVRVAIAPSGTFAVFSSVNFTAPTNELTYIDLATFQTRGMANGAFFYFSDIAILPGEQRILAGSSAGTLEVDVATGQIVSTLPAGDVIAEIAITHDGAHAIVSRAGYSIVELATMTIVADLPGALFPRIAVHPSADRAVAVYPIAHERLEASSTSGAAAMRTWTTDLGIPDEVDAPYALALTPDHRTVVAACPVSRNLAVADVATGALLDVIPLDGASHALAVSPNGRDVLVSLDELDSVALVDLQQGQVVAQLQVPGVPQDVFITPDGAHGIVRSRIHADDYVTFLNLAGAGTVASGTLSIPAAYWFNSSLSPDGTTLGCVGYDRVFLVDIATQSVRAILPTAPGTGRGFWSSDSAHFGWGAGISNLEVATLSAGSISTQIFTSAGNPTLGGAFDEAGAYVYQVIGGMKVRVYDMATGQRVKTVQIPGNQGIFAYYPIWVQRIGDQLLVVRTEVNAAIVRIQMAGPAAELLEQISFANEGTYGAAFAHQLGRVVLPASTAGDGLRVIEYGGSSSVKCVPSASNSTGFPGNLEVSGPLLAADIPVHLDATSLPPQSFGFFLVSRTEGSFQPAASQGTICLGNTIGRLLGSAASTGLNGSLSYDVDLSMLPLPASAVILPGDTLYFQAWHRDQNPNVTSNLTHSVEVMFR
jgi:DNA-binding beta-propeller fold protein YncE